MPVIAESVVTTYLFESPGLLIAALAVVWAIMRVAGRRMENKKLMRASWVPLVLCGVVWLASSLVTTKREHLEHRLKDLLLSVEDKDTTAFREIVLPNAVTQYEGQELTREQVEARLDRVTIEDVMLLGHSAELDPDDPSSGAAYIRVRVDGEVADFPGISISEWAIRWRYEDGRWRVLRLICEKMGVPGSALDGD